MASANQPDRGTPNSQLAIVTFSFQLAIVRLVLTVYKLHPWCQQDKIVEYCKTMGIVVEAYSPLTRSRHLNEGTLVSIASAKGKSSAQVLIRYCLQKGWVPLPKSDTPARIKENAEVYDFQLDEKDMQRLDSLNKDQSNRAQDVPVVQAVDED